MCAHACVRTRAGAGANAHAGAHTHACAYVVEHRDRGGSKGARDRVRTCAHARVSE